MQHKKILIIDDDPVIRKLLTSVFESEKASVITAENGEEGLRQFYDHKPDLVVIDVMMPGLDGVETSRRILQLAHVPIIMLTSSHGDRDILRGFDAGVIDYVTKPFKSQILIARAKAALRQVEEGSETALISSFDDGYLSVDLDYHRIQVNGTPVKLTKTEYKLFSYLFQNANRILSFQQILGKVWGWEYQDSSEYVHVYVSRIRQKIEKNVKEPEYLQTEYGIGYRFRTA